ncbi:C69 family dipeptidase, partial [Paenibacillus farraposensis]
LGVDPLVDDGLGEEDITAIVLPYIHSAREGVKRLGALLEQYGTYETNGICFSDKDECWYFESIAGHHWAAIRIPDDAYVIAPNRFNIDDFDFDSDDTLFASDLPKLIDQYHLNPDRDRVDLRHIFGSATIKDTRYNNPRAWYGQKYFNPEIEQDPFDQDLPFICRTQKKISIEDVKFVLSSHYQNTKYDVYGSTNTDA